MAWDHSTPGPGTASGSWRAYRSKTGDRPTGRAMRLRCGALLWSLGAQGAGHVSSEEGSHFELETEIDYAEMTRNLRIAARRFPNCRVASCDCNEFGGEWEQGCMCGGHFKQMTRELGHDDWSLTDFGKRAQQEPSP